MRSTGSAHRPMGKVSLDAGGPAGTPEMHQTTAPHMPTHMPTEARLGTDRSRPQRGDGVAEQWAEMLEALMDLRPVGASGRAARP